nr:AAA family ATPase [Leptolyngbyaceae cyanobacterium MO_188.B28]
MTDAQSLPALDPQLEATLEELIRALTLGEGEFVLILAVCNAASLRQQLIDHLHQRQPYPIADLALPPDTYSLYQALAEAVEQSTAQAVMVTNLETLPELAQLLVGANRIREEFRHLGQPLVLWITDRGLQRLVRDTPDLYSWADTVAFETPTDTYIEFLRTLTQDVWSRVLNSRENQFLSRADLGLASNSPHCLELTLALKALERQSVTLPPDLRADLAFVQGRICDQPLEARQYFEESLALWQSLAASPPPTAPVDNGHSPSSAKAQERMGLLQFYLGLWWRSYAVRHRAETETALAQAKTYFQQAVETFEQANQPELAAAYINYLAETLQRQRKWPALKTLLDKALPLHERHSDRLRKARGYGFLAEVNLANGDGQLAQHHASQALTLQGQALSTLPASDSPDQRALREWEQAFNRGWYLFSLGKAQRQLGEPGAVATLEQARDTARADYDPDLYRSILASLREVYFEQGDYLLAFETQQTQAAIESRFNYRAFIGAGRIQPKQAVANPGLPEIEQPLGMAPEIMASGREADVLRLMRRIEQDSTRFTVIHGPSGVGKSSIIEAGLTPALGQLQIHGLRVLLVLQRVYRNWTQELHRQFDAALAGLRLLPLLEDSKEDPTDNSPDSHSSHISDLLAKLRQMAQQKRTTVLIFDQFEEFFFDCQETAQRQEFYEFLQCCLTIPFVNVVLSLREDYLSYVLEGERLVIQPGNNSEDLLDDILKKDNREYLGNFSPDETQRIINSLIEQTPYAPEPALITQVVADLAVDQGEVRPIELQIVGAQLQAESITTLVQYNALAAPAKTNASAVLTAKEELVRRYLDGVVTACGPQQKSIAQVVMYLLTDEHNTRPLKTREDLEQGLTDLGVAWTPPALDLVLKILVGARLAFAIPTQLQLQYQLVHDYLAVFVRRQQEAGLIAELRQTKVARRKAEAARQQAVIRFNRFLRLALAGAGVAIVALVGLSWYAFRTAEKAKLDKRQKEKAEIEALTAKIEAFTKSSASFFGSRKYFDALTLAIRAKEQFKALMTRLGSGQLPSLIEQESCTNIDENLRRAIFIEEEAFLNFCINIDENLRRAIFNVEQQNELTKPDDSEYWFMGVDIAPDGSWIAAVDSDQEITIWNHSGEVISTFDAHERWVNDVAIGPDGNRFVSVGDDGIGIWHKEGDDNTFSLRNKEIIPVPGPVPGESNNTRGVVISPDGNRFITGSFDGKVRIWNNDGTLYKTST